MLRRALIASVLALAGCSTVETSGSGLSSLATSGSAPADRIQLKVRTGSAQMDQLVYELAYQQFSDVIPLREAEPYTGTLEITFASSTQSAFFGSSNTYASGSVTGSTWYTGAGATGHASGGSSTSTISTGAFLDWQNSTMLAVLKRSDGQRLWSADYSYKGGWELSGWVVNTPEEAARLVAKRLKAQYVADTHKR
jgi:hypothetical protein